MHYGLQFLILSFKITFFGWLDSVVFYDGFGILEPFSSCLFVGKFARELDVAVDGECEWSFWCWWWTRDQQLTK